MEPPYAQFPGEVSLNQIEEAFFADREMFIVGQINSVFHLQIYHSEDEDATANICYLLLCVGKIDEDGITLVSEEEKWEDIVHHFKLDPAKVMWDVHKNVPRYLTQDELKSSVYSDDEIQQVFRNRGGQDITS